MIEYDMSGLCDYKDSSSKRTDLLLVRLASPEVMTLLAVSVDELQSSPSSCRLYSRETLRMASRVTIWGFW